MTGDKTKEGQATVIEAPYRQPAGSLANEKFRLRCGVRRVANAWVKYTRVEQ